MAKFYAWSDIYHGGDVEVVKLPNGGERRVTAKRNITVRGTEVTASKLGVDAEQWQGLLDGGSVRDYALPEGIGDRAPLDWARDELGKEQATVEDQYLKAAAITGVVAPEPTTSGTSSKDADK